ncbi:MAG: Two-component system, response regulator, stage 0 sporulation protein [Acidobacteria bacterium]|nr:Two-component system, response regulator, stage 0 sporulation protein [Acidobacteriota bacterium]
MLVAQAESTVRRRLFKALLDHDIDSDGAADAAEALARVAKQRYQLIVLDLALPGATTEEVLAPFRNAAPAGRPIVIVTGNHDGARNLDHELVQIVLRPPVDLTQLAELVQSCLRGIHEEQAHVAARRSRDASAP